MLWALQNGAVGCISGLGNAMPHVLAAILKAFNSDDITEAERNQATFAAFRTDLYALGFAPAMVKRALYLQDDFRRRQPPAGPAAQQRARRPNRGNPAPVRTALE